MNVLSYPLRYLALRDEHGRKLYRRNWPTSVCIALVLTAPFVFLDLNYFSDEGFLDRFGGFSAVLTGFYIAALVGVASFSASLGELDDPIEIGKITRIGDDGSAEDLTRRQYVCAMFGYLAFISLVLSVLAILLVTLADIDWERRIAALASWKWRQQTADWVRGAGAVLTATLNLVLSHMLVTTCHGLYYLIDRLYASKAVLLPKR